MCKHSAIIFHFEFYIASQNFCAALLIKHPPAASPVSLLTEKPVLPIGIGGFSAELFLFSDLVADLPRALSGNCRTTPGCFAFSQ